VIDMTKMFFKGGKSAPSNYEIGIVYDLPRHSLSFPWFELAPSGFEVGDRVDVYIPDPPQYLKPTLPEYDHDFSIPEDAGEIVTLKFRLCKNAPSGYEDWKEYQLPLKYARLPWWVRVY